MNNNTETVFDSWVIGEKIGSGTDGRVAYIHKQDGDGKTVTGVLKTIFFSSNRNESRDYNKIGSVVPKKDMTIEQIVESVANNIDVIMEADGGKRFVKYLEYEVRQVKDGYVLYIRMEQMRSLENLLREFSLTQEEAIQIGLSVCKSLIRSRKFNYIYPYLKPENILFDERGVCKLGDFGSFSYLEPSKASIAYKKSECFMDPDFIRDRRSNTTSDTYALGMVLYMLTNRGRLPFTEPFPQPLTAAGIERSKKLRMEGAELPRPVLASDALFAVIKKACAFDSQNRYLHPSQMFEDLKSVLDGKPLAEPKFEEVYSEEPQPAPQPESAASSAINDFFVSQGMPDQNGVRTAAPAELTLDSILADFNKTAAPAPQPTTAPQSVPQQPARAPVQKKDPLDELRSSDEDDYDDDDFDAEEDAKPQKSLRELIKIPYVRPREHAGEKKGSGENPLKKVSSFFVRDLPQNEADRDYKIDIKRTLAVLIAIVVVIIMLCVSCSIRSKSKKADASLTQPAGVEQVDSSDEEDSAGSEQEADNDAQVENNADTGDTSQISNG